MSERPLPPGQQWVAAGKWPLVGERAPAESNDPWEVRVCGLVRQEKSWDLGELRKLPPAERMIDIHCVTRWSKPDVAFRGVLLADLLQASKPQDAAAYVSFVARSERKHSTSLKLSTALKLVTLIAWEADGEPLATEHGGPVRVVVPGRYFYKSLKWMEKIELLAEDSLGYWEAEAGYHNEADPQFEQRYMAPNLDKQTTRKLLEARDFSGHDLRSIDCRGRNLAGLVAKAALLRDADFRQANLAGACFDGANLSNAHLEDANLQGATFRQADLEGANLTRADLRGADFFAASLFGASFCSETDLEQGARFDAATQIDPAALEVLTPHQARYVQAELRR